MWGSRNATQLTVKRWDSAFLRRDRVLGDAGAVKADVAKQQLPSPRNNTEVR